MKPKKQELSLRSEPAPKPARKRPNTPVTAAIDAYHDAFVARFGFKPVIYGGKDGDHFKKLLDTWGEEKVTWLIAEFFRTTDPRVLRSNYSVDALFVSAQHLMLRKSGHSIDQHTAENIDAAARAMGRK